MIIAISIDLEGWLQHQVVTSDELDKLMAVRFICSTKTIQNWETVWLYHCGKFPVSRRGELRKYIARVREQNNLSLTFTMWAKGY